MDSWVSAWTSSLHRVDAPQCASFPLPPDAAAFLASDDTRLPASLPDVPLLPGDARRALDPELCAPPLPAAELALASALSRVGGSALVKVCGAAPLDAAWASSNGDTTAPQRCMSVSDVWTLLKASDRVRDASRAAAARGVAPWVDVRAWLTSIDPSRELRAYVRADGSLAAIAARYEGALRAFPTPASRADAETAVADFLSARAPLRALALAHGGLVLDVLVRATGRVRVIDVSSRAIDGDKVGGGLTWDEIDGFAGQPCALRFGDEEGASSAGGVHFSPMAAHAFPDDVFDFAALRLGAAEGRAEADPALVRAAGKAGAKGWVGLIESLSAEGLFAASGRSESESDGEESAGGGAAAGAHATLK